MIQALLVRDIGNVDHSLDAIAHIDETTEVGEAGNRSFHHRANCIFTLRFLPRIAERLPEAQRNAMLSGVHSEHYYFHHFPGLRYVARLLDLLRPRHLRHVNQSIHAGGNFDESSEIREPRDLAL